MAEEGIVRVNGVWDARAAVGVGCCPVFLYVLYEYTEKGVSCICVWWKKCFGGLDG